jgi:hypothetical protein
MTGRDLISASLRLIGAIAPGESIAANEATDGLASINRMLDSWSNESLLIYSRVREEFVLTPNTQSYTIGATGVFVTTRPMRIDQALIRVETSSPAIEYKLNILSLSEWASINQKASSSTIPTDIYIEGTYPNETVNLYPMPSAAYKVVLFSWKPLSTILTLDTAIAFPPGYERALVYNGAIELAPEYGKSVSPEVAKTAEESKSSIKRMNTKPSYLTVDRALISKGGFNIITGGSSR